jgi:hypothetical protein
MINNIARSTNLFPLLYFVTALSIMGCQSTIKVHITSDPLGANIYYGTTPSDLKYAGTTPKEESFTGYQPYWLPGYYQFKKEGFLDSEIIYKEQSPVNTDRLVWTQLIQLPSTTIKCYIASDPFGANIYYGTTPSDLKYAGTTPKEESFTGYQPSWAPGYYQFKKEGFLDSKIIFKEQSPVNTDRTIRIKLEPIVEKSIPRVNMKSFGTAWPIGYGYLVTNSHVIQECDNIYIILQDGTATSAEVKINDKANDIAVLRANDIYKLPPAIPLGKISATLGTNVFTIGYPTPDILGTSPKLTSGIVSSAKGIKDDPRFYQITVPIQPGNSGGPLLNMKGEAIGIVNSSVDALYFLENVGRLPENVNFAIKSQYIEILLQSLPQKTQPKFLHVKKDSLEELSKRLSGSILMIVAH